MFTIAKRADGEPVRVTIAEATKTAPAAVVVLVPIDSKMRRRALRGAQRMMADLGVDYAELEKNADLMIDVSEDMSRELMRLGIVAVEGIGDEEGKPFDLTPTPETRLRTAADKDRPAGTIDDLLADETIFARLDADYVMPDAKRRAEKNGFAGSPDGTSTGATPGSDIANSAAKRTTKRAAAKNARTRNTRSRPKTAKRSGRS